MSLYSNLASLLICLGAAYFVHSVIHGAFLTRILSGLTIAVSGAMYCSFTEASITPWAVWIGLFLIIYLVIYLTVACEIFRWPE